jgi:hypothetical protein
MGLPVKPNARFDREKRDVYRYGLKFVVFENEDD